jgi:hypothetical protein
MSHSRQSKGRLPLLFANGALGAALLYIVWQGTSVQHILQTPARVPNLTSPAIDAALTPQDLEVIQQAALFYPSRKFYVVPQAAAQIARPNYRLVGALILPNKASIATLTDNNSGAVRKVKAGDDLEGWIILSIEPARVIVQRNADQYEITRTSSSIPGQSPSFVRPGSGTGLTRVPTPQ